MKPVLVGRLAGAEQDDSGQQALPGTTVSATAPDGPARYASGLEFGGTDHRRAGQYGGVRPGSSSHPITMSPATDKFRSEWP